MNAFIHKAPTVITEALPTRPVSLNGWHWLVIIAAIGFAAVLGYWVRLTLQQSPSTQSAEAGFARDMSSHHAQAVQISLLLYDRTTDPEMKQLALDIALTQQAQIGQMQGWLNVWGRPIVSTGPAMSWMGMPTTGLMPGMATLDDLNRLEQLTGVEADVLFLQLMIPHHRAAVEMSQFILDQSQQSEVLALAESMLVGQQYEIDYLQSLLTRKGASLVSDIPDMSGMRHATPTP